MIEIAIPGEEWTVPLIDEMVLPPIRIGTPHAFFDYEAKYLREDTAYEFPEDTPIDRLNLIVETAQQAAKALGATPPFIGRRDPSLTNARAMVAFITEVTQ